MLGASQPGYNTLHGNLLCRSFKQDDEGWEPVCSAQMLTMTLCKEQGLSLSPLA